MLNSAGHDVLALAGDPRLEGLDDPLVLELAAGIECLIGQCRHGAVARSRRRAVGPGPLGPEPLAEQPTDVFRGEAACK